MDFFLFLLANAALFLRPAEVVPGLQDMELYKFLIVPALLAALPAVIQELALERLGSRPISICVLGLWLMVPLSLLAHGEVDKAGEVGLEFSKVVAYYFLFVAVVHSAERLRRFLWWLAVFTTATVLLAVLRYQGVVTLPTLAPTQDLREDSFGGVQVYVRLAGTGIFQDPNDFSLLLVWGIPLALYFLTDGSRSLGRLCWLGPLALFGYALILTQSRGGLLAVLLGLGVLFRARFGARRALLLLALAVPLMFLIATGRQRDLQLTADTAQQRYQLWSDGLIFLREAPLVGIGAQQFQVRAGLVAHNSFLHAYSELGFLGGTLFLGAFFYGLWELERRRPERAFLEDPRLRRGQPYVLAVVAGYAALLLSLSHVYSVPTYMVLGLTTTYLSLAVACPPVPLPRFTFQLVQRLALAGIGFLLATYILVRLLLRWS